MNDHDKEIPASLSQQIEILLQGDDPIKAVDIINDETNLDALKESSWNIVKIVTPYLKIENAKENAQLFKTCETILNVVAEKCKPSETVLEILEEIENEENDVKLFALLKPLKRALQRLEDKSKSFDWCTNTIKYYIDGLPPYENKIAFEEIDSEGCRIIDLYKEILLFLKPFIEESSIREGNISPIRNHLLSLLLSLLGKPLCQLPESLRSVKDISEMIVINICKLTGDCFRFLSIVVERDKRSNESENKSDLFESTWQVSNLSYANFYYYLLTKESLIENIPQVYDLEYILHNCFYLAYVFLEKTEPIFVSKGLSLIESIIDRPEKYSLSQQTLEFSVHSKLFSCLTQVIIYCESDKERKRALKIFKSYIDLFTIQARYQVLLQLYKVTKHSGLLSLISVIVKDSVIMCLERNPPLNYFLGSNLHSLLSIVCNLQHGSATDLIEIAEEIIAALNLLRFLSIRDSENVTGFWNYVENLEKYYLKDLRTGIDLSRAHWKLKLNDLNEEKNLSKSKKAEIDNVTVTVGGENLSMLPISEKIKFTHQALNALDMIEIVLIRVNECLENHRLKFASKN
ncbi:glomulin [Leptopilina heterotoma]|uniref:glomulin n=1 Tax=Leptopilina heterotoma TaxID=63436 RepID=UPI001CA7BEE8|nr:glomulin [Leptopilina heterotoma]XP_043477747.1 glomulin [Leptopilina heterotoma]